MLRLTVCVGELQRAMPALEDDMLELELELELSPVSMDRNMLTGPDHSSATTMDVGQLKAATELPPTMPLAAEEAAEPVTKRPKTRDPNLSTALRDLMDELETATDRQGRPLGDQFAEVPDNVTNRYVLQALPLETLLSRQAAYFILLCQGANDGILCYWQEN